MKSDTSAGDFVRGTSGAVMAETAIIIPLLLICLFGALDFGLLLWQWNSAAKATHFGARLAITSDPVAVGIQNEDWIAVADYLGEFCQNPDGSLRLGGGSPVCAQKFAYCHGLPADNSGVCCAADSWSEATQTCSGASGSYAFDAAAFTPLFARMKAIFPALRREHVRMSYVPSGLGFVGHPYGTPMILTVGIRCRVFDLVALDSLLGWVWPANPCGQAYGKGISMPGFRTSFSSEDLRTPDPL